MRHLSINTLTLLGSNVGSAALSLMLSILIGRFTGEAGLGIYATALAWITPLTMLVEFGINTLITREASQPNVHPSLLLSGALRVYCIIGTVVIVLVWLAAPLLGRSEGVVIGLRISAPLLVIAPVFGAFTAIFRAQRRMWPIPLLNVGMLLLQVTLTMISFARAGDVYAALVINVATSAGQAVAAWLVWKFYFRDIFASSTQHSAATTNARPVSALLRRAAPFATAAILAALQLRLGTLLLERLTTAAEVGRYVAAARFIEAAKMPANSLFGALLPALSALHLEAGAFQRMFQRVTVVLCLYGALILGGLMVGGDWLIQTAYGSGFNESGPLLQISAFGLLPALLRSSRTLYWYAYGEEQLTNRVSLALLVIQLGMLLLILPGAGAVGLALVILVTETVGVVLLWKPRLLLQKANVYAKI